MPSRSWKSEIINLPNFLSISRLLLIPVYIFIYLNAQSTRQYIYAGIIMIISCLTDMIDGKVARRHNMVTTVGKILDPLADKTTQLSITFCLSLKYPELKTVLTLLFLKETVQIGIGLIYLSKGKILSGALMAGKICTTVLFISLIVLVMFPAIPSILVKTIAATDICFLMFSFICYLSAYYGKNSHLENFRPT